MPLPPRKEIVTEREEGRIKQKNELHGMPNKKLKIRTIRPAELWNKNKNFVFQIPSDGPQQADLRVRGGQAGSQQLHQAGGDQRQVLQVHRQVCPQVQPQRGGGANS